MLRELEASGKQVRPLVAPDDRLVGRDVEPGDQAGPAEGEPAADADRLVQLLGGGRHGAVGHHRGRRGADRHVPALRTRGCSTKRSSRSRRRRASRDWSASAARSRSATTRTRTRARAPSSTVEGARFSVPGDWAEVNDDGNTLTLLGRGSVCINTGGEKVFPEEVEEAIKRFPGVQDVRRGRRARREVRRGDHRGGLDRTRRAARRRGADRVREAAARRLQGAQARRARSTRSTAARPARPTSSARARSRSRRWLARGRARERGAQRSRRPGRDRDDRPPGGAQRGRPGRPRLRSRTPFAASTRIRSCRSRC